MAAKADLRFARPDTTLPPGLQGPTKGEVLLIFRWTGAESNSMHGRSSNQAAHVLWWGENGAGSSVPLVTNAERGLIYTVTCGPKAFARYLTDMPQLQITVMLELESGKHTTETKVDLSRLPSNVQVTSRIPVTAAEGRLLGTANLAISLSHTPLMTSFEVNEHLASTDFCMPLYPTTSRLVTPLRQLNSQANANARLPVTTESSGSIKGTVSPSFKHSRPKSPGSSPSKQAPTPRPSLSHILHSLGR